MKKSLFWVNLVALCAVSLALSASASAQNNRSWIAGDGNDTNNCTLSAPCQTYAGAIAKTNAGGEINTLRPGSFGQVTITKAITIDAGGVFSGISLTAGAGITINAGTTDVVILRGLSLNGLGQAKNAIVFNSGASLTVENSSIQNFGDHLINFIPAAPLGISGPHRLYVSNCVLDNSQDGSAIHMRVGTAGDLINAQIEGCTLTNNQTGVLAEQGVNATVRNTTAQGRNGFSEAVLPQATFGFVAQETPVQLNLESCSASHMLNGIRSIGGGPVGSTVIRISNSNVFNNTVGLRTSPTGTIVSFGNNKIDGNGSSDPVTSVVVQQ